MDYVLFDMDGTLTPARQPASDSMAKWHLPQLAKVAKVGVVSGSGIAYIQEQLLDKVPLELAANLTIFPCNGTQVYKFGPDSREWICAYEVSMRDHIGEEQFRDLTTWILLSQVQLMDQYPEMPTRGHFFSDRLSMVNWSPIGREAGIQDRQRFVELDQEWQIRRKEVEVMENHPEFDGLTVALGGQTSFDIYPDGWDKTYAFRHLGKERIWFVGDKCGPGGNDQAAYEEVQRKWGTGRSVLGPKDTKEVIKEIIKELG